MPDDLMQAKYLLRFMESPRVISATPSDYIDVNCPELQPGARAPSDSA